MNNNLVFKGRDATILGSPFLNRRQYLRIFILMKLTVLLIVLFSLQLTAKVSAQKVTLTIKNGSFTNVLEEIQNQMGYGFSYNDQIIRQAKPVTLSLQNASLEVSLLELFEEQPFSFEIIDNIIIIKNKAKVKTILDRVIDIFTDIDVKGIVVGEKGEPLVGATVTVKGMKRSVATGASGEFYLKNVKEDAVLVIDYVGYSTKQVNVSRELNVINLELSNSTLDNVQVIGYGTTTKRLNTGAVSMISADEIAKQPVANPLNALQGRMTGVVVSQANGLPGSAVTIQIRGQNSLTNGTLPLYIIDGIPFNTYTGAIPARDDLNAFGLNGANRGVSPFSVINPNDIASIDILKDADATSIYGSRGANGVVLITTKTGKSGKTRLDVNVYTGIGKVANKLDMLNTQEYLQLRREAFKNDGIDYMLPTTTAPDLKEWDQNAYTDWQEKYSGGTALTTDAQFTLSGGDTRTRALINVGYHDETTVFPGDLGDSRISGRFNIDHNSLDRKLNVILSGSYSANKTNLIETDISSLYTLAPNMPLYNPDGTLYWGGGANPESYLLKKYIGKTDNFITNASISYKLLEGLVVKGNFGFTKIGIDQNLQNPAASQDPSSPTSVPTNSARFADINQETYIFEPQVNYNKQIGNGQFSALFGGTIQQSVNEGLSITASNYSNPELLGSLSGAGSSPVPAFVVSYTQYRYVSAFTRLGYNWKDKYILNATIRTDGSTRFGPGNRFGTFGSVGGAWLFSSESFVKENLPWLSFGKLRSSFGTSGNDQFGDYAYRSSLASGGTGYNYQGNNVLFSARLENPLLRWETTRKFDLGLEVGFLQDRILFTSNYYLNRSDNQVGNIRVSASAGSTSYVGNLPMLIQNNGLELELNTQNFINDKFKWKTSFNLTLPKNKLLEIDPSYFNASSLVIGQPLSVVMRYVFKGIDPTTGRPQYAALNNGEDVGDLTFTPSQTLDRIPVGTTLAKAFGGMNNEFTIGNFDLSFFMQFVKQEGNILFGSTPGLLANVTRDRLEGIWNTEGQAAEKPRASTTSTVYNRYSASDAIWGDASWIRLRNVSLSYNFNGNWVKSAKMSNLRIYLQGQNLLVFSKQKNSFDPETGTNMPPLRVFTVGLNCSF